jgi:hypothetical protein
MGCDSQLLASSVFLPARAFPQPPDALADMPPTAYGLMRRRALRHVRVQSPENKAVPRFRPLVTGTISTFRSRRKVASWYSTKEKGRRFRFDVYSQTESNRAGIGGLSDYDLFLQTGMSMIFVGSAYGTFGRTEATHP